MVSLYREIVPSNTMEQATDAWYRDKSPKHCVERKKANTK